LLIPQIGNIMPSSINEPEYGKMLPLLINGTYTPEQFCQELTKKALETALD